MSKKTPNEILAEFHSALFPPLALIDRTKVLVWLGTNDAQTGDVIYVFGPPEYVVFIPKMWGGMNVVFSSSEDSFPLITTSTSIDTTNHQHELFP